jgi:hypothetical protein
MSTHGPKPAPGVLPKWHLDKHGGGKWNRGRLSARKKCSSCAKVTNPGKDSRALTHPSLCCVLDGNLPIPTPLNLC